MLGLIAGGGALPLEIAERRRGAGLGTFVVRLEGLADAALAEFPGAEISLTKLSRMVDAMRAGGCDSVCFAGVVRRPDFARLAPDLRDLGLVPGIVSAARQGDDALLRHLLAHFEQAGFQPVGAHEAAGNLTLPPGALGRHAPSEEAMTDARQALTVVRALGRLDVGQAAVVARGLVLAVEAQEGTDAMLRRVAELPEALRGTAEARCGVLVKARKPIQEERVDLPTLGVSTIENAARAGLAGVVAEAGKALVLDRPGVIAAADRLGLFVYGLDT